MGHIISFNNYKKQNEIVIPEVCSDMIDKQGIAYLLEYMDFNIETERGRFFISVRDLLSVVPEFYDMLDEEKQWYSNMFYSMEEYLLTLDDLLFCRRDCIYVLDSVIRTYYMNKGVIRREV